MSFQMEKSQIKNSMVAQKAAFGTSYRYVHYSLNHLNPSMNKKLLSTETNRIQIISESQMGDWNEI